MALDGIFVHHLTKELHLNLFKSRLETIHENGVYIIFKCYLNKERKHLIFNLSASFASCYLDDNIPVKTTPSNFTNQLKRYLEGGIIESISQYKSDRVILFDFTVYDYIEGPKKRTLIFEAMGKHANLILLEDGKIIDCYKRMFVLEGRHLVPNAMFEFFKDQKMDATDYEYNPLLSPKEISQTYQGISLRLAKYLYEHPIHPYEIEVKPTLSLVENKAYFFNIFEGETKYFQTLSHALSHRKMETNNEKQPYLKFIKDQLKKIDKKEANLLKQRDDATQNLALKEFADYIYQTQTDLTLKLPHIDHIELDPKKTLSQNAQLFYKLYQKAKRSEEYIVRELEYVYQERDIFQTFLSELELSDGKDIQDFKEMLIPYGFGRQQKAHKTIKHKVQIQTIHDEDATYFIGKNSLQNGHILKEIAHPKDYWFHLKDGSGSHVVVRCTELSEKIIRKAAMLAAYFSSFRHSSSIPILYTLVKYLSKVPGKPDSFVRVKNEKTIFIDIDEDLIKKYLN